MPAGHPYPNFLIVGMMKAGTTSVYEHLAGHPRVVRAVEKELHYFTRDYGTRVPPATWSMEYGEMLNFDRWRRDRLYGEASPSYIAVPERLHAFNPECRIIILLRDPAARAVSQLRHYHRYGYGSGAAGFIEDLERVGDMSEMEVVQDSLYADRVRAFAQLFQGRTALVSFEAFVRSPQTVMSLIFDFLGLEDHRIDPAVRGEGTERFEGEEIVRPLIETYFRTRRGGIADLVAAGTLRTIPDDPRHFSAY